MLEGRLLTQGSLTLQDVQGVSKMIETLSRIVQDKKNEFTKKEPDAHSYALYLKQTCFKENPFSDQQ